MSNEKLDTAIEDAISKIESNLPAEINEDIAKKYIDLDKRLKEATNKLQAAKLERGTPEDSARYVELNKEYLILMREALLAYKELVVPELVRHEVRKLKGVAQLAKVLVNG